MPAHIDMRTALPAPGHSQPSPMSVSRNQIPLILSRRFQRAAGLLGALNKSGEDVTEETLVKPHGEPHKPRLPPISHRNTRHSESSASSERGIGNAGSSHPAATSNALDSPTPDRPSNIRRKNSQAPNLPPATPYKPFPLSETSSFSPASIPKGKLRSLAPQTVAKYEAYTAPPAPVAQMIERSGQRAKARLRDEKRLVRQQIEAARMKWGNGKEREDAGEEMARRARERMRKKLNKALAFREMELQFLVEGQRNSIDAIRLKEYLALRPHKTIDIPKDMYTDEDRVRVDRLLAG
ncbi:uncharacterized protein SPPG_00096 [Spizellomyces punctatus DAOM BR117]|uniref:Uncharacterized protein n=1 Tax=Spizellomyces punctatus (strain DAOM BR117) TaxID=645134 RepID=A0A0L0HTD5_SPIPD|nr:uncharacterized protein SPPG_00096 [Spizellomyces punctatus DAOM BR117]KND04367.1 hypothetical protein SPPG_00096 [Spizellomyces punctatus DAOM BR117]|eukprot:XP_016612406.1 hypothetical protein SPPG_00096 [Spizellomyces punctatus DAOM BR117]